MAFLGLNRVAGNRLSTVPVVYTCALRQELRLLQLERVDLVVPAAPPGGDRFRPTPLAVDRVLRQLVLERPALVAFTPSRRCPFPPPPAWPVLRPSRSSWSCAPPPAGCWRSGPWAPCWPAGCRPAPPRRWWGCRWRRRSGGGGRGWSPSAVPAA
ncbi:protein of unknown function [Candidatus Hydrogenisulfobacillus filiaventi]|uniref:Uncharacterized protein n=1 Tax=Candidatus Hydrogenisulfobacillus filiaventi TaxID=2707344 RepID=A0A6F8ZEE7_9FIRM|nr:protein of unknown function [Candidatus Hydrogenisulfobacillus filiaventi]